MAVGVDRRRGAARPRLLVLLRRRPARPVDRAGRRLHAAPPAARRSPTPLPLAALAAGAACRWRDRGVLRRPRRRRHARRRRRPPVGRPAARRRGASRRSSQSDAGLAMRSLPRAVPLVALGLAVLLGAGVERARRGRRPAGRPSAAAVAVVAVAAYAALPPLWTGGMVADEPRPRPRTCPTTGTRPPPTSTRGDDGTRVLEVPGVDFASLPVGQHRRPDHARADRPAVRRPRAHPLRLAAVGRPAQRPRPPPAGGHARPRRPRRRRPAPGRRRRRAARRPPVRALPHAAALRPRSRASPTSPGLGDARRPSASPSVNTPVADAAAARRARAAGRRRRAAARRSRSSPSTTPCRSCARAPAGGGVVAGRRRRGPRRRRRGRAARRRRARPLRRLARRATGVAAALDDGAALVVTDGNRAPGPPVVHGARHARLRRGRADARRRPHRQPAPAVPRRRGRLADDGGADRRRRRPRPRRTATRSRSRPSTGRRTPSTATCATEWRTGASADVRGERLELRTTRRRTTRRVTLVQQLTGVPQPLHHRGRAPRRRRRRRRASTSTTGRSRPRARWSSCRRRRPVDDARHRDRWPTRAGGAAVGPAGALQRPDPGRLRRGRALATAPQPSAGPSALVLPAGRHRRHRRRHAASPSC